MSMNLDSLTVETVLSRWPFAQQHLVWLKGVSQGFQPGQCALHFVTSNLLFKVLDGYQRQPQCQGCQLWQNISQRCKGKDSRSQQRQDADNKQGISHHFFLFRQCIAQA